FLPQHIAPSNMKRRAIRVERCRCSIFRFRVVELPLERESVAPDNIGAPMVLDLRRRQAPAYRDDCSMEGLKRLFDGEPICRDSVRIEKYHDVVCGLLD